MAKPKGGDSGQSTGRTRDRQLAHGYPKRAGQDVATRLIARGSTEEPRARSRATARRRAGAVQPDRRTLKELQDRARELGVRGRSTMNREELKRAVQAGE